MAELDPEELRRRLDVAGVTGVAPLAGGASSLTFKGVLDGRPVVIKVAPPGIEPVAHRDVLRQARIIKALAGTRVPVPEVLWEDPGDPPHTPPLFVMSHVEGDCVEPLFDGCAGSPGLPERYRNACRAMAALHSLSPSELGLGGEPIVDAAAEVRRWSETLQTVDAALVPDWPGVRDALLGCAPTAMRPSVVHGDFRLGNLLAAGSRISAVIDWEIWSVGDPRIDAGWFLINCDPDTYRRVPGSAGMVPPVARLAEIYQEELGREVTDLAWFRALACFKSAATWSLIVKHNRRRRTPRAGLEAMAATLPGLLDRARSLLD
ncbi:phosphotransferase family protein [Mycobacterium nebraskense]|uniref:Acyl-CoA dehydrogenase n=1 Tax=Mycobacterium nebraskense TaxID=244292 RepID=A0A0F5NFQ3_9MYCO|nr:phosphotransferase family protein [Mycobacterium nebraskense]KKC05921.1 acyl-CoA dehydrogenase [Mycobacterium nebraskense]KLO46931.1 acyl-CoA dehydrogenase [Mycobacterium nebraskense]MBI2695886.1 phosphotransferase family protein [Mycobacterium nebraskense]MCV7119862.1 phosphotransferase family protein [Mycobacterium nebraskense]ORW18629.1 acyl-CoA dehydrogenase [Mycobacterium nebraskense]